MSDNRRPHFVISPGLHAGPPLPGEFVTRVRGEGLVTVTPGRDADWDGILAALRLCAPRGSARRYHRARVLYHGPREVKAVGGYPHGALLGWAG